MDKLFHPTLYLICDYVSMLGLKLNVDSKNGPQLFSECQVYKFGTFTFLIWIYPKLSVQELASELIGIVKQCVKFSTKTP